jgi:hypothetical protein
MTLPWTGGILTAPSAGGNPALIGGWRPEVNGEPEANDFQTASVDFNGTTEYLANTTAQALNFTNAWTISFWVECDAVGGTQVMIDFGGTENSSTIRIFNTSSTTFQVLLDNAAGTLFKDYTFDKIVSSQLAWTMHTVTWDGTSLRGYHNGIEDTAPIAATDAADSQTNANRGITIGAQSGGSNFFAGSMHSVIVWDVALSANAVKDVWCHGMGMAFNPLVNQGDYSQASDVVHWWRLGHDPTNIGKDYATTGSLVDIDTNAANVTALDVQCHYPGGAHLNLVTSEILRKGLGGAGGGTSTTTLSVANSFSVEMWVRMNTIGAVTLFDANKGDSDINRDSDSRIQLRINASNFEFRVFDSSGTGVTVTSSVNARANEWYHIMMVKNGTSRASLYINGVEDAFTTTSVPTTTDASRIIGIGGIPITPSAFADCQIHSCAMWSTALDTANVQQLYFGGHRTLNRRRTTGGYNATASLVHWWRFAKGTGVEGAGGSYVCDQVTTGGIDLTANASNIADADIGVTYTVHASGGGVDFDGTNDYMTNGAEITVGIANAWSVAAWFTTAQNTAVKAIFNLRDVTAAADRIDMRYLGNVAGDPLGIQTTDSAGVAYKDYRFLPTPALDTWCHFAVTWDGTNLLGYINGVASTPTLITDAVSSMGTATRQVTIGDDILNTPRRWDGDIGSVALWSSALTADEVKELSCHGLEFSPESPGMVYASQATLVNWWVPGKDPDDLGNDWKGTTDLTPTSLDDTNIKTRSPFFDL